MKNGWTKFLEEHELSVQAIPVAIAAHEFIGLGWLGGTWFGCYSLQPSKNVASLVSAEKVKQYMDHAKRYIDISLNSFIFNVSIFSL
jgi:hypothetical protein